MIKRAVKKLLERSGYNLKFKKNWNSYNKIFNKYQNYTMVPKQSYCENLFLVEQFCERDNGIIVECGVWRGGMIAGISEVLGINNQYFLFDSFEGLPKAKEIDGQAAIKWQNDENGAYYHDNCKAEMNFAQTAMELSGNANFNLIKGWFSDTLPKFILKDEISLLRLDGDWYDSTMECLKFLYPKVKFNGLIIIDDYFAWDGCSRAVHDYLSLIKSNSRICESGGICYIIKKEK